MQNSLAPYEPSHPAPFVPTAPPFSPSRLVSWLVKYWWLLILTVSIPVAAAVYYVRTLPALYTSKATAFVRGKVRLADVGGFSEGGDNSFNTQIQLLMSDRIQRQALARLTSNLPELKLPRDADGRFVFPRVRAAQSGKSSMLSLECTSPSREFARAFLDALMEEYLAYKKEVRATAATEALSSVSAQVFKHETDLRLEQEKLLKFTREHNVALLEENLRGGGSQLAQLNSQIAMLKLELELLSAASIERKAGISGERTNAASTSFDVARVLTASTSHGGGANDVAYSQQQLEVLLVQRDQLARYLKPKHPKMIRLNDEIDRAKRIIDYQRNRSEEQITATKEATLLKIKSMEAAASVLAQRVTEANQQLSEMEQIKTGVARQQGIYDHLLTLLHGLDLNRNLEQEEVAILESASEARQPRSQNIATVAGAGGVGVILWVGIVFLLMRLDDRCESVVDLRARFPEPVFGQIPELEVHGPDGALPIIQTDDARHVFVESCRGLRSTLLFGILDEERPKVIMVTSAAPSEGKSTVAVNLATTLAQGGARVLLIDADIRRGRLHKTLKVSSEPGLRECVLSDKDPLQFIVETSVPGLSLLPRGKPYTRGDLFLMPSFDAVLKTVRAAYDFVVVDSIPVFAADDSATLAPKVDGVLFVLRRAHTSARIAQEALDTLYQRQAKVLGIVFNRADSESKSYNYYKYKEYHTEDTSV